MNGLLIYNALLIVQATRCNWTMSTTRRNKITTRCSVYASTPTTAFDNCTCIVHVVHSVDTRSQRPAQHTGLYIELVAAISTVFCHQNNNNVIITAPAVSLCVVAARSCCGAEELESSRQRDTLHQTIIVVDVARVYRL